MPLLPDHDHAIASFIGAFLEEEARKIASDDDEAMQAILSSSGLAIAAFAERWNGRSRVHTRLPPELLALCFGALSFDNLLTVSRVSRQWRAIALDTPTLWANFRISSSGRHPGKFGEMLRRSRAAPLSVDLVLTADEEALLRPHFGRLRELVCTHPPRGPVQMPMLRKLKVARGLQTPIVLSAEYIAGAAISLRTLQLDTFTLAPTCPVFCDLRVFNAVFTQQQQLLRLLKLCPALESLTVRCAGELGRNPPALFVPLPVSLVDVSITGIFSPSSHAIIERTMLEPWIGHAFRRLQINQLTDLSGIIPWFTETYSPRPWQLGLSHCWKNGGQIVVCSFTVLTAGLAGPLTPDSTIDPTIEIFAQGKRERAEPRFVGGLIGLQEHFGRLTTCTVSPPFFVPLVTQGVCLPALTELTLEIDCDDYDLSLPPVIPEGQGISAPALRSFAFVGHRRYRMDAELPNRGTFGSMALEWFYATLPRELRRWVLYNAPRLERLILDGLAHIDALPRDIMKDSQVYELADVVLAYSWDYHPPS